jgi:hypothetical protein
VPAALTCNAIALNNKMTNLASKTICSALQFSTHDDATTNASAKCDHECIVGAACCTHLPFGKRSHGGVIFYMHFDTQAATQFRTHLKVVSTGQVWRRHHYTTWCDKPWNPNAKSEFAIEFVKH